MTLKNVELVKAGTHAAMTGVTTLTADDLSSMATAYVDQLVDRPVIKLGHDDDNVLNAALGDGEPAYGWIENVAVGDGSADRPNKESLYGDIVGMPAKLEAIAPKAFRRRSVEIAHGVKAASGKAYRAVLTGMALLGVKRPAVKGLEDILALYSDMDAAESVSTVVLVEGLTAEQTTAFSEALEQLDWADEIDTAAIPHTESKGAESGSESTATNTDKEKPVTTISKADVEKALEKAGDEDVTELLNGLLKPAAGDEAGKDKDGADTEPADEVVKTAASAKDDDTVTITKETFTQLSDGAAAGIKALADVDKARRDGIVTTALREGRIAPAEQETWRKQLDANEETTVTLLGSLQPRFSTTEIGDDLGLPAQVTELGEAAQKDWDEWANESFGTSLGVKND